MMTIHIDSLWQPSKEPPGNTISGSRPPTDFRDKDKGTLCIRSSRALRSFSEGSQLGDIINSSHCVNSLRNHIPNSTSSKRRLSTLNPPPPPKKNHMPLPFCVSLRSEGRELVSKLANIGALIIRRGFWGPLYRTSDREPPKIV